MPTFSGVTVDTTVDVDFEVYCNTCGEGLCNESETGSTRNRGALAVRVNACPKCMAQKDDEIADANAKIDELQDEINGLQTEINQLHSKINNA